jgi:hypothetical protein
MRSLRIAGAIVKDTLGGKEVTERCVVRTSSVVPSEAQSEKMNAGLSIYGDTPTFNCQKIPSVKASLRVQIRLKDAKAALRPCPVYEFCLACNRPFTSTSRSRPSCFPGTRPRFRGELPYAEQHMLCLDRVVGKSIVTM